jgi:hypothetical protein
MKTHAENSRMSFSPNKIGQFAPKKTHADENPRGENPREFFPPVKSRAFAIRKTLAVSPPYGGKNPGGVFPRRGFRDAAGYV